MWAAATFLRVEWSAITASALSTAGLAVTGLACLR